MAPKFCFGAFLLMSSNAILIDLAMRGDFGNWCENGF